MTRKDITILCSDCGGEFLWQAGEQEFYEKMAYVPPKKCRRCRMKRKVMEEPKRHEDPDKEDRCQKDGKSGDELIDTKTIVKFIRTVEDYRGFSRDMRLVFAHMVEEIGELSRAIWEYEKEELQIDHPSPDGIGMELLDIVFLACYLADILAADLNELIPERMDAIRKQYKVPK